MNRNYQSSSLQESIESEIMFLQHIQQHLIMDKKEELLRKHPYKIWMNEKNKRWYSYLPDETASSGKKLIVKTHKEKLEQVICDYWLEQNMNPTFEEMFNDWNDRRLELKKISNSTHLRNVGYYERHLKEFGKQRIKNISVEEWCDFLEEQVPKYNLTAKGFAGLKTIIRGTLRRALRLGYITYNPEKIWSEIDVSKSDYRKTIREDEKEVFNEDETEKIITYLLWHLDLRNMVILLMFITGMRVGEATTLTPQDIDDEYSYVNVRHTEAREVRDGVITRVVKDFPKTAAGVRTVVVPKEWRWFIQRLAEISEGQEFVFENPDHTRLKEQSVYIRLKRVCKKLGIVPKSPHKIRKTYASMLLDYGVDREVLLQQVGHTTIGTTERYYHRNRKSIDRKADILSSIPDFSMVLTSAKKSVRDDEEKKLKIK